MSVYVSAFFCVCRRSVLPCVFVGFFLRARESVRAYVRLFFFTSKSEGSRSSVAGSDEIDGQFRQMHRQIENRNFVDVPCLGSLHRIHLEVLFSFPSNTSNLLLFLVRSREWT